MHYIFEERSEIMGKNAHLTYDERLEIQHLLIEQKSFREISQLVGKNPSTIAKEIKGHFMVVENRGYNPCLHRKECRHRGDICIPCKERFSRICNRCSSAVCIEKCPDFVEQLCDRLLKPPYVCNGCKLRHGCRLRRHVYDAKYAQKEYESIRSESRQGFAITPEELRRIDEIISPLIRQGQSIHHICVEHGGEIMLDERTVYNYIDAGLFSVRNLDLPRKVRYRKRKRKKTVRIDKKCHIGRTYEEFLEYVEANPDVPIVEMDSVEGNRGGKVLLTIYFRNCSLMLAYLREHNTAKTVTDIFENLYQKLGHEMFSELFPVILTDRGSEFTDPLAIEFNRSGERRSRVFYCDPQRSNQKGGIEVTHEMIRRIVPKGNSFDSYSQEDISKMMSHINSYKRKKLGNRSAYQLFSFLHGEGILENLDIKQIPPNEINLTPLLLKK